MRTFPLFGKTLSFTEKELEYTRILRKYTKISEIYREKYRAAYENFGDWQTLIEQGEEVGNKYIVDAAEELVKAYVAKGIYDYTPESALCVYKEYFEWKGLWNDIDRGWTQFCEQYADVQDLRELRKQSRSRVSTVGFGVKGTIGAAIANEAANAATGLLHDLINGLANSSDYAKINRNMQKWYKNKDFEKRILDSFQNAVFALSKAEEELYEVTSKDHLPKNKQRADALMKNLQYIDDDKKKDIIIEVLQMNPYCSDAYEMLLSTYGDPQAEVYAFLCLMSRNLYEIK